MPRKVTNDPMASPLSPVRPFAPSPARLLVGLAASGAVSALAYRRGSLSRGGVAGAMLVGTTIFAGGGLAPSALLLTFFTSSSALSHWRKGRLRESVVEHAKGERRDFAQTIANGGVAAALVALGRARPASPWFPALVGALATVNADTWATELGLFSNQPPHLITTGRPVLPGTSGGITPLGTGAAALGAALIGTVTALCSALTRRAAPRRLTTGEAIPLALIAGLAGSFADSLLGATLQARYHCPTCDALTERPIHRCGTHTTLTGGYRMIDNDAVNFAASLCGATIGWLWGAARG
jgi:uncharacterized protein (TIGR00297 family)